MSDGIKKGDVFEEKYRALFEASRDAIMTIEPPSWRFTTANQATLMMFRAKSLEEFLSYEPWRLSPEFQPDGSRSDEKAKAMIEKAVNEGINFFEWVHKRIGGEDFFADVLLSKVELGGKVLIHALVRDISLRKKLERELLEAKNEDIRKVNQELTEKIERLEFFNRITMDREERIIELKKEIADLKEKLANASG